MEFLERGEGGLPHLGSTVYTERRYASLSADTCDLLYEAPAVFAHHLHCLLGDSDEAEEVDFHLLPDLITSDDVSANALSHHCETPDILLCSMIAQCHAIFPKSTRDELLLLEAHQVYSCGSTDSPFALVGIPPCHLAHPRPSAKVKGPEKLTCSSLNSSNGPLSPYPALLTTTSTRPNVFKTSENTCSISACFVTSSFNAR